MPGSRWWLLTSTAHSVSPLTEINLSYPLKPPIYTLDSMPGYSGCALHNSEDALPPAGMPHSHLWWPRVEVSLGGHKTETDRKHDEEVDPASSCIYNHLGLEALGFSPQTQGQPPLRERSSISTLTHLFRQLSTQLSPLEFRACDMDQSRRRTSGQGFPEGVF